MITSDSFKNIAVVIFWLHFIAPITNFRKFFCKQFLVDDRVRYYF